MNGVPEFAVEAQPAEYDALVVSPATVIVGLVYALGARVTGSFDSTTSAL